MYRGESIAMFALRKSIISNRKIMKIDTLFINKIKNKKGNNNKVAQKLCFDFKNQYPINYFILSSISVISQKVSQGLRSLRANIHKSISINNYLLSLTLFVFREGKVKG